MKYINTELEHIAEAAMPDKNKRKVQITLEQLVQLATDQELKNHFLEVINSNPDIKANMAIEIAKALKRQTKIEELINQEKK